MGTVKYVRNKWVLMGAAAAAITIFAAFRMGRKTTAEYFTARVERGDIREVVEATGTINAVTTVQVGSQVSGTVSQLFADFNSTVKKGQLIAQIEPSLFEGALLQARADLENARANLAASQANLERAKATAVQTKAEYERTKRLAAEGVLSQQQLEVARANAESADAAVSASQAQVTQAAAQVKQRSAAVEVSQTNLSHTRIIAPIDGTVVSRNVDVGQTVAASLQAPTLFTIAQDLTEMQVYAKTDESDVGQIQVGQQATFKVDAFPRDNFGGRVMQVRMNATVVQNVVTYDTVVEFKNPELKLFPGMTAYVTIPVASAHNVLKIANGAIRYKPDLRPEEIRALYAKYGIKDGLGQGEARPRGREQPGGASDSVAPQPRTQRANHAILWKLRPDKTLEPVHVRTGITDRTVTELVAVSEGTLNEGDVLVTGESAAGGGSSGTRSPLAGQPRRR
ncbi:MAG TPA: efflux RND transporter periplasmic adaptor subunit [Terriglobales bacterium]|nr:efflux RND transporter periplasmic adaptor subunit [Terriglobales bacterium]